MTITKRSESVLLNNYGRLAFEVARGESARFWDENQKLYIDFFAGFGGAGIAGHSHPQIAEAICQQAKTLQCHGNLFTSRPQVELAEILLEKSFQKGKVFFCHSGSEANEAALKLAKKKHPDRNKIFSFDSCFHGRTCGSLSLCPEVFQTGFTPLLPGVERLPYGSIEAIEKNLDTDVAAVFVEPIQGEGGMNVPCEDFMLSLRTLCTKHDIVLVMDEVWTAPARTGKWFAYQHFSIVPDVITAAKALGGGAPLAACIVSEGLSDVLGPGTHGCTMGGNPLCATASLAALRLIENEQLCERAEVLHDSILSLINEADLKCFKEVRGKGLFIGIELHEQLSNKDVMLSCLQAGLSIGMAKKNTIRLAPPLVIRDEELNEGIKILLEVAQSFNCQ